MVKYNRSKAHIGLPANLLVEDAQGLPNIFSRIPGFNRDIRRWLATVSRSSSKRTRRRSDADAVIELLSRPRVRRFAFWKHVGDGPPDGGEWNNNLYMTVDFWLLRELESRLDLLRPLDDETMRQSCPCWDAIVEDMKAWSDEQDLAFDARYFALWPRLIKSLINWKQLDMQGRVQTANGAFALSSIAGDPWFVEEAERLCPAITPYFEGLELEATEDEDEDEDEDVTDPEVETGDAVEPDSNEPGTPEETPVVADGPARWRAFGEELRSIAETLNTSAPDPSIVEILDLAWIRYEQLKADCPLRASAATQMQGQVLRLEEFFGELNARTALGAVDPGMLAEIMSNWRAQADAAIGNDEACEQVRHDAESAEAGGRAAAQMLADAHSAWSVVQAECLSQQEVEKAASGWSERRAAREQLAQIEEKLAGLRRSKWLAEEAFVAAVSAPDRPMAAVTLRAEEPTSPVMNRGQAEPVQLAPVDTAATGGKVLKEQADPRPTTSEPEALPDVPERERDPTAAQPAVPVKLHDPQTPVEKSDTQREADGAADAGTLKDERKFNPEAGNICAPIWQALRVGNVPLAHHAAAAIRELHPDVVMPSPALLSAVALGRRLQSPAGPIAEALRSNFADIDRNDFETGPEPWRLANNFLLLSACLRPLILAPDTGASGVAEYVHLGSGLEPLYEVQQLLADYGQRLKGNRLDAAALGATRSKAAWDSEFGQLRRDAAEWFERAPRFTVKFKAATDVWRRWIAADGVIGRLSGVLQSTNGAAVPEVLGLSEMFGSISVFRTLVDETDRRQLKRNRGEGIHSAAFEQLRQKGSEVVAIAERWLSLMEARPDQGDYLSRQLGELQEHLTRVGRMAMSILDAQTKDDDWGLVPAARLTLKQTLAELMELFSGSRVPVATEPRPEIVFGEALLNTGLVSLDADWRPEPEPRVLLDAIKSYLVKRPTPREALEGYVSLGDFGAAQRLLDLVDGDSAIREELTSLFEKALVRGRDQFRTDSRAIDEKISLALAYGLIGEKEKDDLQSRVAGLELGPVASLRFDRCSEILKNIESELAQRRSTRAAELSTRLAALGASHPDQDYSLIATALEEGDFPTATEYLHRVEQDPAARLAPAVARDRFNDFFPVQCRQLQQLAETLDATSLRKVIQERLNASGVSFKHLSSARANEASSTWVQWSKIKATRTPTADMLRVLLSNLGFRDAVVTANGRTSGRVREFSLVTPTLSEREVCQSPHFGSRTEGRYRIACLWDPPGQEDIRLLAGDSTTGAATIALYFGALTEQKRRELSVLARGERRQSFLLLDELLLLFICGEEDSPLAALFQCGLPFTYSDPFVTTSSVVPPEMFFGRAEELASIKSMDGRCFVYGGRQLGKTALLRQAEREFHSLPNERVAVWIDLKRLARPDEIWVPIWRELRKHGVVGDKIAEPRRTERATRKIDDFVHALEQWMAEHPKHRILLLLDEADRFLEFDARDGFPDTRRLKSLMEVSERRFKVVFAGLHNVLRTTEQANHPLAHFGEAIEVGPLIRPDDLRAARDLVLKPMMAAGFAFESERGADRILSHTNYYPSLIQLYCSKLLHELLRNGGVGLDRRNGPRYLITARHLDSVYGRQDLRDEIRTKFLLTLQLDPRYNLITYALASEMQQGNIELESGAAVEDIRRVAEAWWKEGFERTTEPAFRVLLQEMVGLGVLRQLQPGRFTLRNPNVLLLLGSTKEIGEELLRDRELPTEYEPRFWRMALSTDPTGPRRSPLTVSQAADVVARSNGIVIVAGSEAAGIREVQEAVSAVTETGFFQPMKPDGVGLAAFQRTLDRLVDRKSGGTTVLFVGPDCAWSTEWIDHAIARIKGFKSKDNPVRVVFAADPTTLRVVLHDGLTDEVNVVSLEPWTDDFLKEWLQETNQASDAGVRKAILEQSGGWAEFIHESHAAGAKGIDAPGEARRRLERLGIEDSQALSQLDAKSIEEIRSGVHGEAAGRLLRWAELLGLARVRGGGKICLEPYVSELLMRV